MRNRGGPEIARIGSWQKPPEKYQSGHLCGGRHEADVIQREQILVHQGDPEMVGIVGTIIIEVMPAGL